MHSSCANSHHLHAALLVFVSIYDHFRDPPLPQSPSNHHDGQRLHSKHSLNIDLALVAPHHGTDNERLTADTAQGAADLLINHHLRTPTLSAAGSFTSSIVLAISI